MKIYTKLGDKGETSLVGGKRVPKDHPQIEATGTIDELISVIAVLKDYLSNSEDYRFLTSVQKCLMNSSALVAADNHMDLSKLPQISAEMILELENKIDETEDILPPLNDFIIPGGHLASSYCHVARNVCRRAERILISLLKQHKIDQNILKYFNRLSDYLFVLSRKILIDNGLGDILWKK